MLRSVKKAIKSPAILIRRPRRPNTIVIDVSGLPKISQQGGGVTRRRSSVAKASLAAQARGWRRGTHPCFSGVVFTLSPDGLRRKVLTLICSIESKELTA